MFISFRDTEATGGFAKNSFNEVIRAESKLECLVEKELEMQTPSVHNWLAKYAFEGQEEERVDRTMHITDMPCDQGDRTSIAKQQCWSNKRTDVNQTNHNGQEIN